MRDRGQAAVATVLVAGGLLGATLVGAVELGDRVIDRRRAQSAADAAALAGAVSGASGAGRVAAANGATLQMFGRDGAEVTVVVTVDSATATARASTAP